MPWPIDTYLNSVSINGDDELNKNVNWGEKKRNRDSNIDKMNRTKNSRECRQPHEYGDCSKLDANCMKNKALNQQTE